MPLKTRSRTLVVVIVLVLLVAAALAWRSSARKAAPAPAAAAAAASAPRPALTVTTTTPQRVEWPRTLAVSGSVAAWQEAAIGAEVGGLRLLEVKAAVGDRVARGALLARLDADTVQADLAQTQAQLAEANATVAEAQANAERARQLQSSGAISAQQINQYLTAEQTARARAQALRARLQADQLRLQHTRIVAPDDGVISARTAAVGQVVQPGNELFRLIRQQRLEWRAEVPAGELQRIRPGMPVRITTPAGQAVSGRVRVVAPTVDAQTRNGLVYVDLARGDEARAGMFARGEFELGRAQALTLPQAAVVSREGYSYAFRVEADGRVRQAKVQVGRRLGDRIEIVSGLDANAAVVATGAGFLSDGDLVHVVPGNAVAAPAAAGSGPAPVALR